MTAPYFGNVSPDTILTFMFNTDVAGVPTTLADYPSLVVYCGANTTQGLGVATLVVDFDGVVGLNLVQIPTSAEFYSVGSREFTVVIASGTVGGQSVAGRIVGSFSLGNRYASVLGTVQASISGGMNANAIAFQDESDLDTKIMNMMARLPTALTGAGNIKASIEENAPATPLDAAGVRGAIGLASANLDTQLAAIPTAGSGGISTTVTVNDGTDPLDGVSVWITTDASGNNVVASGITNANGQATFMLDAGAYYLWKQLSGYTFTNPERITVS